MELREQAVKIAGSFPESRDAPRKLLSLFNEAKGEDKDLIGELVEVLYAAAKNKKDLNLVPFLIEVAEQGGTVGEIVEVMKKVYGEWEESFGI